MYTDYQTSEIFGFKEVVIKKFLRYLIYFIILFSDFLFMVNEILIFSFDKKKNILFRVFELFLNSVIVSFNNKGSILHNLFFSSETINRRWK